MEKKIACIRPGLLVQLHVRIVGGRSYETEGLTEEREGVKVVSEWKTRRTVEDQEEWDRAEKVRGLARNTVARKCVQTAFGLLCPVEHEAELWAGLAEARQIADEFNIGAKCSEIKVSMLPGRVAENESEAARAVASEMASLIDRMEKGILACDAKVIRDSVDEIKKLGTMLDEGTQKKANAAIDAARTAARSIVKQLKNGELADTIVASLAWEKSAVTAARFQFLDLEAEAAEAAEAEHMPAIDAQRFAEVIDEAGVEPASLPEMSPIEID